MKQLNHIALFLLTTLVFLSSCKSEDDNTEVRKGLLTTHTWTPMRVSVNGGPNQVAQLPNEFHTFHKDGTFTKVTLEEDGSHNQMKGSWELQDKGRKLRMFTDFFETTSTIRELTDRSLQITREDPDLTVEIDFVPIQM